MFIQHYQFRFGSSLLNLLLVMQTTHSSIHFDKHLLQLVHIIHIYYVGEFLVGVTALHVSNVKIMISYGFTVTFTILLRLSRWRGLLVSFWSSIDMSKDYYGKFYYAHSKRALFLLTYKCSNRCKFFFSETLNIYGLLNYAFKFTTLNITFLMLASNSW